MNSKFLTAALLGLGGLYLLSREGNNQPTSIFPSPFKVISKKPGKPLIIICWYEYDEYDKQLISKYSKIIVNKFKQDCSIICYSARGLYNDPLRKDPIHKNNPGFDDVFKTGFKPSCIICIDTRSHIKKGADSYINIIHLFTEVPTKNVTKYYEKNEFANVDFYDIITDPAAFEDHIKYRAEMKVYTGFTPKLEAVVEEKDVSNYVIESLQKALKDCK